MIIPIETAWMDTLFVRDSAGRSRESDRTAAGLRRRSSEERQLIPRSSCNRLSSEIRAMGIPDCSDTIRRTR